MRSLSTICGGRIGPALGLCALAASACAPKTGHRQTDVMEKAGTVSVSAADLRARVNDLADLFVARLEDTADRIRAESRDHDVRRRALAVKAGVIPAVYTAAYRADPLAAAIDLWALGFQVRDYVETGAGRDAFGPEQPLARDVVRALLVDADTLIRGVVARSVDFDQARGRVEGWAAQHPIDRSLSSRPSIAAFAAQLRSDQRDAFVTVGAVSDTLENLSERLNIYAAQMPKQARWQAELLVAEMAGEHEVEGTLADIHEVGAAARRANDLLGDLPGALGAAAPPIRDAVAAERRALLEGVDRQRLQTLEYLTAERFATLAALHEERLTIGAGLHQERIETLKELDAIKSRAVDSAIAGLHDLVDYALWRVAAVLLFLMLSAAAIVVIGYRLTVGRRPPAITAGS
jgi:hypothetical protein